MSATFESFMKINAALVDAGYPDIEQCPKWSAAFREFYDHPTARQLGARIGRGGAKSTYSARFGLNETLRGDFVIPPGERHYFAFVSESKEEASQRIRLIAAYLDTLGIGYSLSGDTIDLNDLPRGFKVFACRVGAVSGFRCFGWAADEVTKWKSDESYKNPADEVITSLRAMTITHRRARSMIVSSPMGKDDYHFKMIEEGSNDYQRIFVGPSWEWNPTITQEQTKLLERDQRKWRREYLAQPQQGLLAALDYDDIVAAFRDPPEKGSYYGSIIGIDPSGLQHDLFAWAVGCICEPERPPEHIWEPMKDQRGQIIMERAYIRRDENGEFVKNPEFEKAQQTCLVIEALRGVGRDERLRADQVWAMIRKDAITFNTKTCCTDQGEQAGSAALAHQNGLHLTVIPWTQGNRMEALLSLRNLLTTKSIVFPKQADTLRDQLLRLEEKIGPQGATVAGHVGDYAAAIFTLLLGSARGLLPHTFEHAPRTVIRTGPGMCSPGARVS